MSEATMEDAPRRRARVTAEDARAEPALAGAAVAVATAPQTPEARRAAARQKLAAQNATGLRGTTDPALAHENALRKQAGLKPILPPVRTSTLMRMPDPTVILDGDGKPVGDPGMPTTIVPRGDMGGGDKSDTRVEKYRHFRMEPVRYREDAADGRFKAGDIVESPFGVHMQHRNDEDEAAYWATNHPTHGVDAKADAMAQLSALGRPGYVEVENRMRPTEPDGQYQAPEAHYVTA